MVFVREILFLKEPGRYLESVVSRVIRWARNLYIGDGIEEPKEIRTKINKSKFLPGIFLITLSDHPDHVLEIVPSYMLMQKWTRKLCPKIIGMAKGKKEAMLLVADIVREVYENTGAVEVKEYLKKR